MAPPVNVNPGQPLPRGAGAGKTIDTPPSEKSNMPPAKTELRTSPF